MTRKRFYRMGEVRLSPAIALDLAMHHVNTTAGHPHGVLTLLRCYWAGVRK